MNELQKLGKEISKNSPTILTGLSVAGMIGTVVLAVKATPKAMYLIEQAEMVDRDTSLCKSLSKKEIIQATWKCYIPAAVMGTVTIGCIIGSNTINLRRSAALASVYSITEATLKEYQSKVVETIGTTKEKAIRDEVQKDRVQRNPVVDKEVVVTGKGETLCYDSLSGRYFKSDIEEIRKAINEFNRDMMNEMFMSLNDLYYKLGLSETKQGNLMGWHVDSGLLDVNFGSQLSSTGQPCLVLDYSMEPRYSYVD